MHEIPSPYDPTIDRGSGSLSTLTKWVRPMRFLIRSTLDCHSTRQRTRSIFICCAIALAAAGCSPRFNWRDYQSDAGFSATFPDNVQTARRSIQLGGAPVNLTLSAARVDEISFVVGSAKLPNSDAQLRDRALAELRAALIRNIDGTVLSEGQAGVARLSRADPAIAADVMEVSGQAEGRPMHLWGQVFAANQSVYEMFVIGPSTQMQQAPLREAVDTFLTSLRLR